MRALLTAAWAVAGFGLVAAGSCGLWVVDVPTGGADAGDGSCVPCATAETCPAADAACVAVACSGGCCTATPAPGCLCFTDAECDVGAPAECMRMICSNGRCALDPDPNAYACRTNPDGGADGLCDHQTGACRKWCAVDADCDSGACVDSTCQP